MKRLMWSNVVHQLAQNKLKCFLSEFLEHLLVYLKQISKASEAISDTAITKQQQRENPYIIDLDLEFQNAYMRGLNTRIWIHTIG